MVHNDLACAPRRGPCSDEVRRGACEELLPGLPSRATSRLDARAPRLDDRELEASRLARVRRRRCILVEDEDEGERFLTRRVPLGSFPRRGVPNWARWGDGEGERLRPRL